MKARFQNDPAREPGYGLLVVSGLADTLGIESATFSLKRLSDHKNLGDCCWQETEVFAMPLGIEPTGDGARIFLGPNVVDNLDARETYRLFVAVPGQPTLAADFQPDEVDYSYSVQGPVAEEALPDPEQVPDPFPIPPLADRAEQANMATDRPLGSLPQPGIPSTGSRRSLVLSALVLACLVAGGLVAWVGMRGPAGRTSAEVMVDESPLSVARSHLARSGDPDSGLILAADLRGRENGEDAAFLLIEDAAQRGNPKAALELAEFYDPSRSGRYGSVNKNPVLAWEYYRKADAAGIPEASSRLAALYAWARAEADQGSVEARNLLDLMR